MHALSSRPPSRPPHAPRRFPVWTVLSLALPAALGCGPLPDDELEAPEPGDFGTERDALFADRNLTGRDLPVRHVALTFDDGPGERTLELARYLASESIPATFFVVGRRADSERGRAVLRELRALGHLVANHTYSHVNMTRTDEQVGEVRRTDRVIAPYVRDGRFLFRAPYGAFSRNVATILNDTELRKYVGSVFWDVGGECAGGYAADWCCWSKGWSVQTCGARYVAEAKARGRGIILMHDSHGKTVDLVKSVLVPRLRAEGFRFVGLDDVPNLRVRLDEARRAALDVG